MADVFDIDSNYHHRRDEYNNRNSGGWVSVESNNLRKDPRTSRRDDSRKYSPGESPLRSPQIVNKNQQMYNQIPQQQIYQPAPPPPMYNEYNSGYGAPQSYSNYQQQYQQPQNSSGFGQYNQQSAYPPQQGYSNSQHHQPVPPGEDYPNSWAPVQTAYPNINQHGPTPVPRPSSIASTVQSESHKDEIKKEAVAQELKQQRATLVKQRDEYLRKTSVLRRELEKLRMQKHELLTVKSPPRDSNRILRENAKLQLEITTKLKSINNVVDMLSGIIGDGMKTSEIEETRQEEENFPQYNYVHYDPELHWCRVCDVFPRTAKDFLNHLHSNEHRQVTQEHQLVDTPWHKLPTDPELPSYKGAPLKRVPIKGLQFFISATSWYCKLCDVWIGDLHCASLHLKSKNHSHNYSNFVEQNPHWETNWLKDREKAYARCSKIESGQKMIPQLPEPPVIKDKHKIKPEPFLDSVKKEKKRRKKSKKRKKNSSDSSSSSSSSESSSEEEDDKAKSIRVAMRNKMRMQAQMILNEEIGGKLEALRGLVEEKRNHEVKKPSPKQEPPESAIEDNIINQWMTVNTNNDKHILENLKGRLKQRQEADKEKAMEAAQEQRRREREREERELRELREREQREMEERIREEREKEQRDHEERERIKERERSRRKRRSESRSPRQRRSRSRSVGRRHYRPREERNKSPEFKPRKPREYSDDEYDKLDDYKSNKSKRLVSTLAHSRKLPFIGRMPLFKKRGEGEEKEIKKEDYEIRLSKFEHGTTARAFIPEPGVVHIAKLATPVELPAPPQISQEAPPPPKIIPEPPQISETAPPPPIINNIITEPEPEIQDMELDEAVAPLPPGVPIQEGKPLAKPAGNHLPRDFQDALNIIFPGEQPTDPNLLMQYQYQMNYGMMYPGMDMYGYGPVEETELVPESAEAKEAIAKADLKEEAAKNDDKVDDKEDLAMLGIDAEDMAAQIF